MQSSKETLRRDKQEIDKGEREEERKNDGMVEGRSPLNLAAEMVDTLATPCQFVSAAPDGNRSDWTLPVRSSEPVRAHQFMGEIIRRTCAQYVNSARKRSEH